MSFNHFTHASRVAEVFLSREGTFADNNLLRFLEQQTDGLRMSCEFARKYGMESIWTLRTNDKGVSPAFPPTELPLDFSDLADGEVPAVSLNSHGFERPGASEVVGEVRRFRYAVPANTARTEADEICVEGISNKVKLAGADLWIRRMEKFPDKPSSW